MVPEFFTWVFGLEVALELGSFIHGGFFDNLNDSLQFDWTAVYDDIWLINLH